MRIIRSVPTIIAIILLCVSATTHAEPKLQKIEISPVVMNFAVLGEAQGHLMRDANMSCLNITTMSVWLPENSDTATSLVGIRFGLAAPNGKDDWQILGHGEIYPFALELTTKKTHYIPGTIVSCFQVTTPTNETKYWSYMEMFISGPDGSVGTTYSHTKEYSTLMNVPKGTMIGDEQ